MTDSRSSGEMPATPSGSSPSSPSSSPSQRGLVASIVALAGAAAATWMLHLDRDIPWQYRFWGTVAMWGAALLPARVTESVVTALLERLPWGRSGRAS